jgi:hypothetical protein
LRTIVKPLIVIRDRLIEVPLLPAVPVQVGKLSTKSELVKADRQRCAWMGS